MANKLRRGMLVAFMTATMLIGLGGGAAHTVTAAVPRTTAARIHGQLAGFCPPPPYMCSAPKKG